MRKLEILSESDVYYKKCMRQISLSRMSGRQNYYEKVFLYTRFILTVANQKTFGTNTAQNLKPSPPFTLRKLTFVIAWFIGFYSIRRASRQM